MNLTNLKYYDELTPAAQAEARINILVPEQLARDERLALWRYHLAQATVNRLKVKKGYTAQGTTIHTFINDTKRVKRFLNGQRALQKVKQQGDAYLIRFIRDNRTIFTECGAYVAYYKDFSLIKNGQPYYLSDDQQKALRQPYIDVNARGIAYHDWLYRMHHKIKFFMVRG